LNKELTITVLVENCVRGHNLLGEHGLSLWIEYGEHKILFDTGQTGVVWKNARHLDIPLERGDGIVLSHGHYDHTGGLDAVLEQTGPLPLYAHPRVRRPKYVRNPDGTAREAGMPISSRQAFDAISRVETTEKPREIVPGMWCTGPVPRKVQFEDTGGDFFQDETCHEPDDLIDDQALFIENNKGLVVILGCAHSGVINTLNYIQGLRPEHSIHAAIGGTHLVTAGKKRMDKTVDALRDFQIPYLMPMHCTGFSALLRLWSEFPKSVSPAPVGTVLKF